MKPEPEMCEKLKLKEPTSLKATILFGITLNEDPLFLYFKTARKEYRIRKELIISIEQTNMRFKEESQ